MPPTPSILIADDQRDVIEALRLLFKAEGFQTQDAKSPAKVLETLREREFDLALIDLNYTRDTTSGREGLELLSQIRTIDPFLPVVVMTAWGNVNLAVETMRAGARDFVQKPWDNARLLATVRTQIELSRALRHSQRVEAENEVLRQPQVADFIAASKSMQPVLELVERIAPSDTNVLITGENGTGKGLLARALHRKSSRGRAPFVVVNTGGLHEGVFESELFGHVKGAFTDAKADRIGRFEMANGGTLFLDEIANVPEHQQRKLLRVLETGEFERLGSSRTLRSDVRIISATNADLRKEVAAGKFRQDLLFRLNTIEVKLPPLRERAEDIPLLANHFLREQALRYRKAIGDFEAGAIQTLLSHSWPGNVRELSHAVERAVLMSTGEVIKASDLGLHEQGPTLEKRLEDLTLEEMERHVITKALAKFDGNANLAANALGLSRSAFYRRLEKYGL
ncbi:MAG TPA: sigma-54 dependent transcriptional regulator [Candidatus Limnocylindrales bacterium]|jgi:DNA-binding NtrC family response regulator|nr:sigma-54 dependent transcriptional regulator [Candidatus Limnocylindrales bacterium]